MGRLVNNTDLGRDKMIFPLVSFPEISEGVKLVINILARKSCQEKQEAKREVRRRLDGITSKYSRHSKSYH